MKNPTIQPTRPGNHSAGQTAQGKNDLTNQTGQSKNKPTNQTGQPKDNMTARTSQPKDNMTNQAARSKSATTTITTSAADPSEGFDGVFYPIQQINGELRKDKVVITLSGSEGGLQNTERMARFLQNHGIPALALGYFRTVHTGRDLTRIPLEYVENAIRWLQAQDYAKIAVQGISRGAEYAAATAVHFSEISCVILRAPSWFYGEGLAKNNPSGASCWTFRGEELPYAPFAERSFTGKRRREKSGNTDRGTGKSAPLLTAKIDASLVSGGERSAYSEGSVYSESPAAAESQASDRTTAKADKSSPAIPIEKARGPVLLFSTKADTVWPSAESARKLETRLVESDFPYPHKHICYQHMCHIMLENASRFAREVFASEKEFPEECAAERKAMGEATIRWLEEVWK